jgi:metal-responsive CopG/Arc/MetJ family transcriptional regulator
MSDSEESKSDGYTTVRLPNELMGEIDAIIRLKKRGYKSRSEFIKEAIRRRLDEVQAISKQT